MSAMNPFNYQGDFLTDEELARQRAMAGGAPGVGAIAPGAPAVQVPAQQQQKPPAQIAMPAASTPAVSAGVIAPRTKQDMGELQRLETTGSGVSQVQQEHPIVGGLLRGLDIAGSIIAPRIAADIPGTTLHHEQLLEQSRGNIKQDVGEQGEEAAAAHTQAETEAIPAQTAHTQAETNALENPQPKPKEESWEVMPGFQGPHGEPILVEKNSGQQRLATAVPGVTAKATKPERPDTPEQQYLDEYQRTHKGATVQQAISAYAAATQKPEREPPGTWSLQEDAQGHPVMFNSKTGQTQAAPANMSKPGTYEKRFGPARDAAQYADDYMQGGNFTGPGDEALMEKFFEVAKPSTGFKMTQSQQNMLMETRDAYQGIVARGKHLLSPSAPYFDDTQRQHIVQTMHELAAAKEHAGGEAQAQSKQQPANNDPLGIR